VLGKTPGADGKVWVALDDDSEQVITVTAKGVKDYNAGPQTTEEVERFHPHITANTHDLDKEKPEFCVGQKVTFTLNGLPLDQIVDKVGQWSLPEKFVNEKWQHTYLVPDGDNTVEVPYGSENYRINSSLLKNTNQTSCWFVNKPGDHVSVGLNLKFSNGQTASVAARGDLTVYRPKITNLVVSGNPIVGFGTDGGIFIGVSESYGSTRHEMDWDLYVDVDLIDYPGTLSYLQLINDNESYNYNYLPIHHSTSGEYWLDNSTTFGDSHQINYSDMMGADLTYGDAPGIQVSANSYVQKTDNFLTYIQFQPSEGISVTIGIIDWGWVGDAEKSGGFWSLATGFVSGPRRNNDDTFPQWEKILNTGMNQ